MITTNRTYTWSFVTQTFRNGQPFRVGNGVGIIVDDVGWELTSMTLGLWFVVNYLNHWSDIQ
jgi:hypothetical protein